MYKKIIYATSEVILVSGVFELQGIAKYHPIYRIQSPLHRYTLPIFPRHEAGTHLQRSRLKQCTVSGLFKATTVGHSEAQTDAQRSESLESRTR